MDKQPRKLFIIHLNMHEAKIMFRALAEQPFNDVYELIGKLNSQANEVAARSPDAKIPLICTLNQQELDLVVRALGEMPFNVAYPIVENLHAQVQQQTEK